MTTLINKKRLFNTSCLALVVTAFTFAIRANLLDVFAAEFSLSQQEVGEIAAAAFWGFTLAMFIGGPICDFIGMGRMFLLAFIFHITGLVLTIFAGGYWSLFLSTLLVGLGNGFVESASYAMVSSMYTSEKTKMINKWHIWFPAGIAIGGVLSYLMSIGGAGWRWQIASMVLPTIAYGVLFIGQSFPKSERVSLGVTNRQMIRECFRPLFLIMVGCMFLTGATELCTNQWIVALLSSLGVPSILLLVFINGIMTLGRANAGFILKRISTTGLLLASAILACLGLLGLGLADNIMAFVAAFVFATGICFFWPTMIGFVSEQLPKTGPLGLSIMGGAGLMSTALMMPRFGAEYDKHLSRLLPEGYQLDQLKNATVPGEAATIWEQVKLAAGADTLLQAAILPAILIVAFTGIHLYIVRVEKQKKVMMAAQTPAAI
ncbi:MFS transporter [Chitinophaga defluvii]|uniref:MFS transporter n=1 Tax=Chitinophaga defluvii TaxID=3163343 RepID=A0ABV2TA83_9BACT